MSKVRFHDFPIHRGTTAERVAYSPPAVAIGSWFYDTDTNTWHTWNGTNWVADLTEKRTGWGPDATSEVVMSWDDGTRTLTLTAVGATFTYWIQGVEYIVTTSDSVAITDTEGEWYVYYSGSVLTASQTPWAIEDDDKAFVAYVHWDATNNEAVAGSARWEMHGWKMPAPTHKWAHETIGTRYESGLGVSENPADQLEIGSGEVHDEDIKIDITDGAGGSLWEQDLSPLNAYKVYKNGAGGDWRNSNGASVTPIVLDGGNDVQWNEFAGGVWGLTAAGANEYCAYWVLATSDIEKPVVIVLGQGASDNKIDNARANNELEDLDLSVVGPEFKVLARVMVRNIGGGVFYEVSAIDDYRAASVLPASGVVSPLYLLASGTQVGATTQAQDFGALGIKADVIAESTGAADITVANDLVLDDATTGGGLAVPVVDGVTKTVKAAAGDFTTIQDAVNWFKDKLIVGACKIEVDVGSYDEAVTFEDLFVGAEGSLEIEGDTRVLAGLSYVDGTEANIRALVNGGTFNDANRCTLATNPGLDQITVSGGTVDPDFDADGWGSGDKILVFDESAGTTVERTINSISPGAAGNHVIEITVAVAAALGGDGDAILLQPNRAIARTVAGPCVQIDFARGIVIDGFYLDTHAGVNCYGVYALNGGKVTLEGVAARTEDYAIYAEASYSIIRSTQGTLSTWEGSRGIYANNAAQCFMNGAVVVGCAIGVRADNFSLLNAQNTIVSGSTSQAFSSRRFSYVQAYACTARQCGTGYKAEYAGLVYGEQTDGNNNGNTVDYNPAVAVPGSAQGNHYGIIYATA